MQIFSDKKEVYQVIHTIPLTKWLWVFYNPNLIWVENNQNKEDVAPPADIDEATRLLITKLTTGQIAEILARVEQPQLQLEPITHFERYVKAIDEHPKMPRQIGTYVNETRRAVWARQDASAVGTASNRIVGWNLGVTDGTPDLQADRSLNGNVGQKREQATGVLTSNGLRLVAPRRYALAAMRALKKEKPLDAMSNSALVFSSIMQIIKREGNFTGWFMKK